MGKKSKKKANRPRQPKSTALDLGSVSVVVVTARAGEWVADALPGIRKSTRLPLGPVVVDVSAKGADELDPNEATIVRVGDGAPFGAAMNAGIMRASSERVVVIHDDVVPQVDWLESLIKTMKTQAADIVGARLTAADGTIQHAGLVFAPESETGFVPRLAGRPKNYFEALQRYAPPAVSFALALISRSVFDSIGGFDEEYGSADFADVDFCLRSIASGHLVAYSPSCCATHHTTLVSPEVLRTLSPKALGEHLRDLDLFCAKWAGSALGERSTSLKGLEALCERWLRDDAALTSAAS